MAHVTTGFSETSDRKKTIGLGTRVLNFLIQIAEANPRSREIERLSAKSDEQLAEIGLRREDIVRYVMRDTLHI